MPRRQKIGVLHPQDEEHILPSRHTVYIIEDANGSYFTGICENMDKELEKLPEKNNDPQCRVLVRFPVKVVFKEERLPFKEAYLKFKYMRTLNRAYRKKLIDTKLWPASKKLKFLILEKMKKHLEDEDPK